MFRKALDLAQAYELATKKAKDLQVLKPPGDMHTVSDATDCQLAAGGGRDRREGGREREREQESGEGVVMGGGGGGGGGGSKSILVEAFTQHHVELSLSTV